MTIKINKNHAKNECFPFLVYVSKMNMLMTMIMIIEINMLLHKINNFLF